MERVEVLPDAVLESDQNWSELMVFLSSEYGLALDWGVEAAVAYAYLSNGEQVEQDQYQSAEEALEAVVELDMLKKRLGLAARRLAEYGDARDALRYVEEKIAELDECLSEVAGDEMEVEQAEYFGEQREYLVGLLGGLIVL